MPETRSGVVGRLAALAVAVLLLAAGSLPVAVAWAAVEAPPRGKSPTLDQIRE